MKETEEERRLRLAYNDQYLSMPYEAKVCLARSRIWEWKDTCAENGKTPAVSVGGLDSITLLCLVRDELGQSVKDTLCVADAELTNALQLAAEILWSVRRPEEPRGDALTEPPPPEPRDLKSAGELLAEKAKDVNIMLAQLRGLLFG